MARDFVSLLEQRNKLNARLIREKATGENKKLIGRLLTELRSLADEIKGFKLKSWA